MGAEFEGPVFLPYQARWCEDRSEIKIIEKSRRIGISWASAADAVLEAASTDGMDQWYMGYNETMAEEFILDSAQWARAFNAAASEVNTEVFLDDEDKSILTYVIRFASGFRVTALSSRPSNLRSKQGHVIIDEAAFHEDLSKVMKAAIALLMWGGRVSIISTHAGVTNQFATMIDDCRKQKLDYSVHRVTLDDALREGFYRRICEVRELQWSEDAEAKWRQGLVRHYGEFAAEELFCVPAKSGGGYIPRVLIEDRSERGIPVLRWDPEKVNEDFARLPGELRTRICLDWVRLNLQPLLSRLPQDRPHWAGMDFGRVSDLSVIVPLRMQQDLVRRTPFMVELRRVPYDQQREVLFYLLDRLPRFGGVAIDATGNGEYIAEVAWQRYGEVRAERVKLNDPWYAENLPPLKAAFEDQAIVIPADIDVMNDLEALQLIDGIPKLPKLKGKGKDGLPRHGDSAIALVLAHHASRVLNEHFGYEAVKATDPKHRRRPVRATHGFKGRGGML